VSRTDVSGSFIVGDDVLVSVSRADASGSFIVGDEVRDVDLVATTILA
jgi:hypothetical protein